MPTAGNTAAKRRCGWLEREAPTVFGIQEGYLFQVKYIEENLPQYGRVGVGRDDGKEGGEIMAVFYLRDRYDLLDHGDLWLSETPDRVSRGWDGACNRTMTWVHLREKATGKELYYFNTHLDHKGVVGAPRGCEARRAGGAADRGPQGGRCRGRRLELDDRRPDLSTR